MSHQKTKYKLYKVLDGNKIFRFVYLDSFNNVKEVIQFDCTLAPLQAIKLNQICKNIPLLTY